MRPLNHSNPLKRTDKCFAIFGPNFSEMEFLIDYVRLKICFKRTSIFCPDLKNRSYNSPRRRSVRKCAKTAKCEDVWAVYIFSSEATL